MVSPLRFAVLVPLTLLALLACQVSTASAAPANDNFASAQTMTGALPITVAGDNIDATAEAGEPMVLSIPPMSSVWYRWTPASTSGYVLDTCDDDFSGGSSVDPVLGVYSGNTLATLVGVAGRNGRCSLRFTALAGTTYYFQVDYYDIEGTFNLTLRNFSPPVNDNFATPTVLGPSLPITTNGTTVDSTWEAGESPSLGGSSNARSVWYSWTAPATERVRVSLCEKTSVDGPANDAIRIYTGATLGTLAEVAFIPPNDCVVDLPVTVGTTYRIAMSGSLQGEFLFVLGIKAAPVPANDNFANAQTIGPGLPVNATGNNDFATGETGEPDHGEYPTTTRSVWYRWTAPVSGPMRIKTCNRDLRFFTSVYTGNALNALTDVSTGRHWTRCSRYFDAVSGTTYRIAVAGATLEDTHGPFALNIHQVVLPANDSFDSAIDLGSPVTTSTNGTTVDATLETGEPSHVESYGNFGGSVWYRWTAPNDNAVILSACSSGEPARITVFGADPEAEEPGSINGLRNIDSDDYSCRGDSKGGRLAIAPVKGTGYFIGVTSAEADYESPFTLKIEGTAPPKISKPSGFNLKRAIRKCRKIKGKSARARRKRANCIRKARRKAAVIKCRKLENRKARAKCLKKANKRFSRNHPGRKRRK